MHYFETLINTKAKIYVHIRVLVNFILSVHFILLLLHFIKLYTYTYYSLDSEQSDEFIGFTMMFVLVFL